MCQARHASTDYTVRVFSVIICALRGKTSMHRIKAWIRAFFGFSRGETNAFLLLLPLMIALLFSEPLYRLWRIRQPTDFSKDERIADSLIASLRWNTTDSIATAKKIPVVINFFSFDPNTASESDFIQLGLPSSTAKRIVRYREKGGTFKKKEALLKMYGLDTAWFEQAKPWITIAQTKNPSPTFPAEKRKTVAQIIDINTADSIQLLNVYGIGPALSKRIRTFRDKLGGFVSLDQVQEVFGLDSTVVTEIKKKFVVTEGFRPVQINLNEVTLEQLKHPYIKRKEAQAILSFRLQHGSFQSIDQLNEIKILTPQWIEKARPYLSLE